MPHLSSGAVRFSSDDLPERDRLEAFLAIYGKIIVKHDLEPAPGHPFAMRGELYALPGLGVASASISPCRAPRRPEHISGDDLVFNTTIRGRRRIRQRGRDVVVDKGGAVLTSADPGVATVEVPAHYVCFRLSRAALQPLVTDLDARLLQAVPHDNPALCMLKSYIGAITETAALETPALRNVVVGHIYDLVALTLGASREGVARADGGGVRAARLRSVKADILQHLGDSSLSLDALAARHKISPRYIGMLFESEGTSFSAFVLRERLAHAQRLLVDPQHGRRRIAISLSIAASAISRISTGASAASSASPRRRCARPRTKRPNGKAEAA